MRIGLFTVVASSLLILLFGYTAIQKLLDRVLFEGTLARTPFISRGAAALSWLVPLSEIGIVLLLLFPKTRFWGFAASAGLLSFFTVYLAVMLLSGVKLPCSCGGVISGMGWEEHIVMNVVFVGLAAWGAKKVWKG